MSSVEIKNIIIYFSPFVFVYFIILWREFFLRKIKNSKNPYHKQGEFNRKWGVDFFSFIFLFILCNPFLNIPHYIIQIMPNSILLAVGYIIIFLVLYYYMHFGIVQEYRDL